MRRMSRTALRQCRCQTLHAAYLSSPRWSGAFSREEVSPVAPSLTAATLGDVLTSGMQTTGTVRERHMRRAGVSPTRSLPVPLDGSPGRARKVPERRQRRIDAPRGLRLESGAPRRARRVVHPASSRPPAPREIWPSPREHARGARLASGRRGLSIRSDLPFERRPSSFLHQRYAFACSRPAPLGLGGGAGARHGVLVAVPLHSHALYNCATDWRTVRGSEPRRRRGSRASPSLRARRRSVGGATPAQRMPPRWLGLGWLGLVGGLSHADGRREALQASTWWDDARDAWLPFPAIHERFHECIVFFFLSHLFYIFRFSDLFLFVSSIFRFSRRAHLCFFCSFFCEIGRAHV